MHPALLTPYVVRVRGLWKLFLRGAVGDVRELPWSLVGSGASSLKSQLLDIFILLWESNSEILSGVKIQQVDINRQNHNNNNYYSQLQFQLMSAGPPFPRRRSLPPAATW